MAKKQSRGGSNTERRLATFGASGGDLTADWANCDREWLQAVVAKITGLGGAVTFGLSRDMGAHMMTLLLDNDKEVLWFNGDADLTDEMKKVMGKLDQLD